MVIEILKKRNDSMNALLTAGGAEMTSLAGECQEVFVAAVFAFHAGTP
jgi:hypothetical protein